MYRLATNGKSCRLTLDTNCKLQFESVTKYTHADHGYSIQRSV